MHAPFSDLQRRLIAAGISPRYARRLAAELADHLHALEERLTAERHLSREQTAAIAREQLGSEDEIIRHVLRSGRFHAISRRWPTLVYVVLPPLLLPLLLIAITVVLALFAPGIEGMLDTGTERGALHTLALAYSSLLVPVTAAAMTALFLLVARRCRCPILWPSLSSVILAALCCTVFVEAALPRDGAPGIFAVAVTLPAPSLYACLPLAVALLFGVLPGLARRREAQTEVNP